MRTRRCHRPSADAGATVVEYALLVALLAGAVGGSAAALGSELADGYGTACRQLAGAQGSRGGRSHETPAADNADSGNRYGADRNSGRARDRRGPGC